MTLTLALKREAHRLGFELVGVTTPRPPAHLLAFQSWLDAGRHGEMAYLAKQSSLERRADPLEILPGCRSILVLGIRYPAPSGNEHLANGKPSGRVAAYAWGDDYHEVFPTRLKALVRFIEAQTGQPVPNRWYTDTGPILERDLAQRAGLGWIGKNTCLIHPRHGSYFLLAEILLGIYLEPDKPFEADRCGSCTRCLEACPTRCILPDRSIDARRCISYLTIELRGAIPQELRPGLGDWVFGCDICQQVCPWNQRFATRQGDPAFSEQSGRSQPDLIEELTLSEEDFNRKFKASPLRRAKRRGYLRNATVVLGNYLARGDRSVIPALVKTLCHDPEALVRRHAAWSLSQAGGDDVRQVLKETLHREEDNEVAQEIRLALGK
jgi:epoxyqueuosine reductase